MCPYSTLLALTKTVVANMFRKIILIIFCFLLLSCQNKTEKLKFEKEVAYEIFPLLIKNLHSDIRLGNPPPP
ncbi:hypothetical protein BC962_3242, partial [Gillisia mitskevichiae]